MTFLKSLLLALFATLFLTYAIGSSFLELLNINVYMEGKLIEPLKAIGFSAVAAVLLVILSLAIVLSMFGTFIFISLLILGAVAMVAIGVFWPVLLIAVVIWLVTGNNRTIEEKSQYG
jgi:hypothetical protein